MGEMDGIIPERLGNLHLVLLHLPIGFVVVAVLLELWRWRHPSIEGGRLQTHLLAANSVAALLAAGVGLILASTGSYASETLALHRWAGVSCAGLAIAAWLAQARGGPWLARVALGGLFVATIVAGHLGATLTHGQEVTTWWWGRRTAAGLPVKAAAVRPVQLSESAFIVDIQPVLERSCLECHGPKKAKGRLRLDSREAALAGGKSGQPAITPGRPEASELLRRVKLPRDDDEAMPSGDGPALTAADITKLEKWIANGATWR